MSHLPKLENNPPIKFAYWVPNVSGGLVISNIPQKTSWDFEYNKKLAQTAERNGFEYALTHIWTLAPLQSFHSNISETRELQPYIRFFDGVHNP